MSSSISLLQLPRLCLMAGEEEDSRVISGFGPNLEVYSCEASGIYQLLSRTSVFGACGRPITAIRRIADSDSFVVVGSSLLCVLKDSELALLVVPSSRIHSFTDEIVTIAYSTRKEHFFELGLVLRSGRTLCVTASIDNANRFRVDTVADYDGAKCGLLMSALCLIPAGSAAPWEEIRCIAGSAMGEVRLWGTSEGEASRSTQEAGRIGFVISMAVVDQCDDRSEATVVAVTENRAINLWRIRYMESSWLQLLHKEEAAHAVRPSAVAYCRKTGMVVSAAEDGELCVWSIAETGFSLARRFQTRVGAVRSLAVDGEGRIIYGSMTGSLFSLPISSLVSQSTQRFIEGRKLMEHFRDCDLTPIRSFAVVHNYNGTDDGIIPQGTRQTELQCLGEDGSTFEVTGDTVSEWVDNEGSYLHLNSWTGRDCTITVFHDEKRLRLSSYHPPGSSSGYTVLSERSNRSTLLTARPTMSRADGGDSQSFVAVQSTHGEIALIRYSLGDVRIWRYRIQRGEEEEGDSKRRKQNQMLIVNCVAIDRSSDTELHVVLGTTNGRILYAPLRGDGEQVPEGDNSLDFALDGERPAESLNLYPRSRRLEKTSITQLEYCSERRECTALTKNGWLMRMRVEGENGLIVNEEDISRELGVEWPVRIERRGEEEYVIGFNARNLLVVSRRLKTCLLSIDCGGGHRQVHVDLQGGEEGYGSEAPRGYGSREGEIDKITVYYGKHQGIVRHTQSPLTLGLRQLAWTPHRDKIVFCTGVDRFLLTGSIDGEIVLGMRDYYSMSVLQRWYVPETTTACVAKRSEHTEALRLVIGGPKGDLYVVEWSEKERRCPPLTTIPTSNETRIIDVCALGDYVVAAFADAEIAVFQLDSSLRARRIAVWTMPITHRSTYTKVSARFAQSTDGLRIFVDAITSGGIFTRLKLDADQGKISQLLDVCIDCAALTVIRHDSTAGIMVFGSDSGAVFVYRDYENSLELLGEWKDAHVCQITDLALFRLSTGALRVASVGMDCTITVLEMGGAKGELSLVRKGVFAVNDPSSIQMMSESGVNQKAIVAGCGMEVVEL